MKQKLHMFCSEIYIFSFCAIFNHAPLNWMLQFVNSTMLNYNVTASLAPGFIHDFTTVIQISSGLCTAQFSENTRHHNWTELVLKTGGSRVSSRDRSVVNFIVLSTSRHVRTILVYVSSLQLHQMTPCCTFYLTRVLTYLESIGFSVYTRSRKSPSSLGSKVDGTMQ